jgi:type I restriction enzyme S subunit
MWFRESYTLSCHKSAVCGKKIEDLVLSNLHYEKFADGTVKCVEDEIPFELPEGWAWERLGNISTIARGGSPRPIKAFITDDANGINWIKIGDTNDSMYITSTAQKIIREGMKKSRYVQPGDFLLSNSMSFGRPYILKIDGCIHDGWLVLRGFQKFYKEDFFYHLLRSKWIQNQFNSLAYGSTVRNLNSNSVSNVIVPIVALEEQQEIADSLDRLQSQAGVLQLNYSQQIADCAEMRQAVLREAFEGRL